MLDEVDIQILSYLQKDGKLTAKNLADRIELTQTPVYERIRKLERSGVIRKYVALLDSAQIGKNLVVFMNISLKEHSNEIRDGLTSSLARLDEVTELYQTSGTYDFIAKICISDITEYRDFLVQEIAAIEGIKDIVSHIVLDCVKYSTELPLSSI
ncbi:MAG: Lrp/AsnC family transcriptional regulator [Bacteroidia bacterium]|nr:Lrp/AsnC family transcriptional regulator [Bacteroidia bacterium]